MSELYLIHFNKNHDPKTGRFAPSLGGPTYGNNALPGPTYPSTSVRRGGNGDGPSWRATRSKDDYIDAEWHVVDDTDTKSGNSRKSNDSRSKKDGKSSKKDQKESSKTPKDNKVSSKEAKDKKVKKPKKEAKDAISGKYDTINKTLESSGDNARKAADELSSLLGKPKIPNTKKIRQQMSMMDNKQLDEGIKRLKLEQEYMKYAAEPTTSVGRQRVSSAVDSLGKAITVGKYAGMTALAVWKLTHWYYF